MTTSMSIAMSILLALSVAPSSRGQAVIAVRTDGPVNSMVEAVRLAHSGDRIVVHPGTYDEPTVLIDKSVAIAGEPGAVIRSREGAEIFTVTADGVTIEGLTLRGVSTSFVDDRAAVRVERAAGCRIAHNVLDDAFFGVYLAKASDCVIASNVFTARKATQTTSGNGIHLWYSNDVDIYDNRIEGHRDGIYLEFSSDVDVARNDASGNRRYGLHFMFSDNCRYLDNAFVDNEAGVAVMYSKNVEMERNRFAGNWGPSSFGLLLKDITDSRIDGNVFKKNTVGIYAEGANRLEVTRNDFVENGRAVKIMANSMESVFRANNFLANTFDVTTNSRQSYSTFEGNYWDAYRGYDLDRDGTGDVPFFPVRLFALIVEQNEPTIILMRSLFVHLMDAAERVLPTLTPKALVDEAPLMKRAAAGPYRTQDPAKNPPTLAQPL